MLDPSCHDRQSGLLNKEVGRILGVIPVSRFVYGGSGQFAGLHASVELLDEHDIIFQDDYQRMEIEKYVKKLGAVAI